MARLAAHSGKLARASGNAVAGTARVGRLAGARDGPKYAHLASDHLAPYVDRLTTIKRPIPLGDCAVSGADDEIGRSYLLLRFRAFFPLVGDSGTGRTEPVAATGSRVSVRGLPSRPPLTGRSFATRRTVPRLFGTHRLFEALSSMALLRLNRRFSCDMFDDKGRAVGESRY